ncbi:MAG: non-ribosomal peptide synthetase, partial [Nostocaceae cyanobacterium CSU_2_110]|nr:non-ribosomal peptide synthetase [Nostocaceae cyanobacterium CSU_2_110]
MNLKNVEDFYPLSPMQQGMLFHSLAAPNSGVYFEQFSCTLKGELSLTAFNYAWQQVIDRHPILRTGFVWEGLKEPVQIVHRQVKISCTTKDWRHLSVKQQTKEIEAFLERDCLHDFELTRPPLMRLTLIQLADNIYHFTWSHHHLLLDGWSVPLIFQEVFAYYQQFGRGDFLWEGRKPCAPTKTPRPYRDYIVWLQQQNISEAETFWRQTLKGFTTPTQLGINYTKSPSNIKLSQTDAETRRHGDTEIDRDYTKKK